MPLKLNSSGGGSVTLDTPSTASTYTLTVPAITGTAVVTGSSATVSQAMLASGVASNGPAFSAYRATAQTGVSTGTWTKVQLNAEYFDTASCFDSTTNYRFTPNVAGYYQVSSAVYVFGSAVSPANAGSGFYKNGSLYCYNGYSAATAGTVSSGSNIIYLNGTTDYIELYALGSVASGTVSFGTDATLCQFSAALVRAA